MVALRYVSVLLVLTIVCLWSGGCSQADPQQAGIQAIPLGASDGYVLIQHTNGKLYTIRLEDGQALAVWNMPDIGKR